MSRSNAISNSSLSRSRLPSKYGCFVGGESTNTIEAIRPLSCHYILCQCKQSKDTPEQLAGTCCFFVVVVLLIHSFTGRASLIRLLLRLMKTFNISLSRVNYLIWVALDLSARLPTTINTTNNLRLFPLVFKFIRWITADLLNKYKFVF